MNPTVEALLSLARMAAALAQLKNVSKDERAAIVDAALDNGASLLADLIMHDCNKVLGDGG